MLKKITLKNYRSYRNQTFEFHPGINGLIGLSQAGKTNLLRALFWVVHNRPRGTKYHSKFARPDAKTKVSLLFTDDYTVSLMKSSKTAQYSISHPTRESHLYSKIGATVPDIIESYINISDLNIQDQITRIFLAASPPSQIAKTINKITKIDDIDLWTKGINSKTSTLKTKKDILVQEIGEINDQLTRFVNMRKIDRNLAKISRLHKKENKLAAKSMAIRELQDHIDKAEQEIKIREKAMGAVKKIDRIIMLEKEYQKLEDERNLIKQYIDSHETAKYCKKRINKFIDDYTKELKKKKVCPTCFTDIGKDGIRRVINELRAA